MFLQVPVESPTRTLHRFWGITSGLAVTRSKLRKLSNFLPLVLNEYPSEGLNELNAKVPEVSCPCQVAQFSPMKA
jgi:hypothetical protein